MKDAKWMQRALDLAVLAAGKTSPNPLVGAVLVNDQEEIVGEGWHHRAGAAHAEVNALAMAGTKARGATAYVTLEPCSHYGRTGPCADALIAAGVRKVVVATKDPNPQVAGKGLCKLQEAGIEVVTGVLAPAALKINEVFFQWVTTGKPFVALKYAMTLDGKIATASGDSKWITGEVARTYAHYLRGIYDGILVGKGTVLADNPALTCRLSPGKNPVRIVLDARLEIPPTAQVLADGEAPTLLVTSTTVSAKLVEARSKLPQVEVLQVGTVDGKIDLAALLTVLGARKITGLLVEGGSATHGAFYAAGLVNRVYAFIAPKIIGGAGALPPIGGCGAPTIATGRQLTALETKVLGQDLLITGSLAKEV
ncbi:MAG: bifunctional diaminohydroxyphosphoribosylaminopyrimidine deaminase/5-amino-6-(5-phosphoribosylamino)uracil reductase RibD [Acidaminococcaceae bacterium]